ncbi:enoyl-CoA hydratase-related protein [Nocardia sp. NPDC052278]|uniref:enoyl-CoA hydratase-related protein n=1 Tax=unclassified Nocardia TaxID=2637762 RepID=UPI00368E4AC2
MSQHPPVLVQHDEGVVTVVIDRPHTRNAIDTAALEAISRAIDELESSPELRVGVLTGASGTFCSGADLRSRMAGRPSVNENGFAGVTRRRRSKPLVAAVEGYCLGGGMELALACDLIIAATDAKFGLPEVKAGLIAAEGGLIRAVATLGKFTAMHLALLGDVVSAERLYALGVVSELTPPGMTLPRAYDIATRIAELPADAVLQTKHVIDEISNESDEKAWRTSRDAYRAVQRNPGLRATVASVLDRDGRSGRPGAGPTADTERQVRTDPRNGTPEG